MNSLAIKYITVFFQFIVYLFLYNIFAPNFHFRYVSVYQYFTLFLLLHKCSFQIVFFLFTFRLFVI